MTKIDLMKQVDKHNKQTKFEECEKKSFSICFENMRKIKSFKIGQI